MGGRTEGGRHIGNEGGQQGKGNGIALRRGTIVAGRLMQYTAEAPGHSHGCPPPPPYRRTKQYPSPSPPPPPPSPIEVKIAAAPGPSTPNPPPPEEESPPPSPPRPPGEPASPPPPPGGPSLYAAGASVSVPVSAGQQPVDLTNNPGSAKQGAPPAYSGELTAAGFKPRRTRFSPSQMLKFFQVLVCWLRFGVSAPLCVKYGL